MKKLTILFVLFIIPFVLSGCNKTLSYQMIERDNYNTGGNITFVYDVISHTATFGGEGETIQFYSQDIAKGWSEEGCRVGIQITVPKEVNDFKSGSAVLGKEKLTAEDFYLKTGDEKINYAIFQPIVSKEKSQVELKITWQEGFEEQLYHIVIKEGTLFMENN